MPANKLQIPKHLRRPKDARRKDLMGNYQRTCKNLLAYEAANPNSENSAEYKRLENEVNKYRDELFDFEKSLSELFPDKSEFPMVDGQSITLPNLQDLLFQAQEIGYEKAGYKGTNNQEPDLDSIIHQVTIPVLQLDKNGNPTFDDNGDIQFANQAFFTLKGNDINEVKSSFQSLLNSVSEKAESSISQMREEVETLSSLIPESHDYEDPNYKQISPDLVVSLEKFFGKDLKELSNTTIQAETLKTLEAPTGQKAIKKNLSVFNYENNVNQYVNKVIEENEGRGPFGYFLNDSNVNYVNNGKIEKTVGRNAFSNHLYSEISKKLSERVDLANKTGNTEDLVLFENTFGNNQMANEMFNQILAESADSTMRILSNYNKQIPQHTFNPTALPNLAPPAPAEPSFYDRMTNANTFQESFMNPQGSVDKLLGYNNAPAPQLDGYGRPIQSPSPYNQPPQSLPAQEQQPQLPSNDRTVENVVRDIPYTPQYAQNNSYSNGPVPNAAPAIDLSSIKLI